VVQGLSSQARAGAGRAGLEAVTTCAMAGWTPHLRAVGPREPVAWLRAHKAAIEFVLPLGCRPPNVGHVGSRAPGDGGPRQTPEDVDRIALTVLVIRRPTMASNPAYLVTSARNSGAVTDNAPVVRPVAPVRGMATLT
jgi:hypothetical protein